MTTKPNPTPEEIADGAFHEKGCPAPIHWEQTRRSIVSRVAAAIRDAEERGWSACCMDAERKAPAGHILTDTGEVLALPDGHTAVSEGGKVVVRKVLGTLPVTADGCVVGDVPDHGALVFLNGYADVATPYRMTLCIRCIAEPEDDADSWSVVDNGELAPSASRWYSTREAAEAAVKAKQEPKP